MYKKRFLFITLFILTICHANASLQRGAELSKRHSLIPGSKASIQWKRIFQNERRLKKYGLDKLSKEELQVLQSYLLEHAADSPKPIVPGL